VASVVAWLPDNICPFQAYPPSTLWLFSDHHLLGWASFCGVELGKQLEYNPLSCIKSSCLGASPLAERIKADVVINEKRMINLLNLTIARLGWICRTALRRLLGARKLPAENRDNSHSRVGPTTNSTPPHHLLFTF
jgi:hypothetical protein